MESLKEIYYGYSEFYGEHYYKWEHAQSKRYFEYREVWEKSAEAHTRTKFPLHLDIGITNVCNLKCTFCARTILVDEGKFRKAQHMDFDLYKKIIDQATKLGTYSVNLNLLNEPLSNPKLIEMIRYAKESGIIDVHFHSHGGLLTEEKSRELIESGLDKLLVSIDTYDKEKYNKLRVMSNHDDVVNNLKKFKQIRDEMGKIGPLVRTNFIQFPGISKEDLRKNIDFGLTISDCVGLQMWVDPTLTIGKDKSYSNDYKSSFVCPQPFTRLCIIEDGTVSPCCVDYSQNLAVGNINEKSLLDIWESDEMENIRKHMTDGKFYEIDTCKNCEIATNSDEGILAPSEKFGPTI